MDGNFVSYKEAQGICVRPLRDNKRVGYFYSCREHSNYSESNKIAEDEFFSGNGRFYNYDIKLSPYVDFSMYQKFITEFLRRGETQNCLIHISNNIDFYRDGNDIAPLYDMSDLLKWIEVTTSIPQHIYFELDDKRFNPTSPRELDEVVKMAKILADKPNVINFLINETLHTLNEMNNEQPSDTCIVLAEYGLYYKEKYAMAKLKIKS
jgi:hypothetical protein